MTRIPLTKIFSRRTGRAVPVYLVAAGVLTIACAATLSQAGDNPNANDQANPEPGRLIEQHETIDFASQILPVLSDNCFACHGMDAQAREADLRLDVRASAIDEALAIEPGDAAASLLMQRITSKRSRDRMPPPGFNKTLEPEEIELIRRWIEQGAEYKTHWAFLKPEQAPLPEIQDQIQQADWPINPIDLFVRAKLEAKGIRPAPEADKRTLIRRVTLDLTGLPPTADQVQAYLNDTSPKAYENVVDRLLASPSYGEHMTRYWLDAVRYGDTHGLHLDNYRSIWPYRDWVINAINKNMPFDQFTIEQIAGDLIENPTLQQQIASGYNRCNITTSEGGTIPEEVYVRNVIDRVETTGTIWLGMTTGCASCHDHKYDPISQQEFYELFAFFNSFDGNPRDNNRADHAPVVRVPDEKSKQQLATLDQQLQTVKKSIADRPKTIEPAFQAWLAWQDARQRVGDAKPKSNADQGLILHSPLDETQGNKVANTAAPDQGGNVVGKAEWATGQSAGGYSFAHGNRIEFGKDLANFEQDNAFSYGGWMKTPGNTTGAVFAKMDENQGYRGWDLYVTNRRVAMHLIHAWPGKTLKATTKADVLKPHTWHHVFVTYDGSKKAKGVTVYVDGKPQAVDVSHDTLNGTTKTNVPLTLGSRTPGGPFTNGTLDDVRIYDRVLAAKEIITIMQGDTIGPLLALPADQRTPEQVELLRQHYLQTIDQTYPALLAEREQTAQQQQTIQKLLPVTLVYRETKEPRQAYVLHRGEYDQKRDEVARGVPGFLPALPDGAPRNRLGFAQWLVQPDHPLTARVTINRYWQQLFGTGLVKTSEDFGVQGEQPSHPQLLDWLAVQFIEDGWDVKKTMKRLVMSATYRQSAKVSRDLYKQDPENRLLARGPRLRLDAEVLRDQALAISGLLNNQIGGPSVKPPQPGGIWKAVGYESSNTANFRADTGDKVYRRSMYIFWKRTAPPPQMVGLDAPNRESCVVRRERTNTPMQALILLNEPQYVESARRVGERVMLESKGDTKQRIDWLFKQTLMRSPTDTERAILLAGYNEQLAYYRADPKAAKALIATGTSKANDTLDAVELAAWTMTANTVINLDEFINKP